VKPNAVKPKPTCYMCEEQATTREHAPPRCFFPEPKDVENGEDLRRNLITVPSCAKHNLTASKDDEYVMVMLVSHIGNNAVAKRHFATKVVRALEKSPAFVRRAYGDHHRVVVDGGETLAFRIDDARFQAVMEKTTRAIVFDHTGQKLLRPVKIISPSFATDHPDIARAYGAIEFTGSGLFGSLQSHGDNPDVFTYRYHSDSTDDFGCLLMTFFGGFEVYGVWGDQIDNALGLNDPVDRCDSDSGRSTGGAAAEK